jgi:hypothetical protein
VSNSVDMTNVELLPVWKKGGTAGDRLREIAMVADKFPEQFQKFVVIYAQDDEQKLIYRYMNGDGTRTSDCIGLCQAGAMHIYESTRK